MSGVKNIDFSIDLLRVLTWQRNNAAKIQALIQAKQAWTDENVTAFWDRYLRQTFTLETADEFGLSVWAIILGQPLSTSVGESPPTQKAFGFGSTRKNFGHGNFVRRSAASSVSLSLEQKRLVLRARYYQLISRGTVPEINAILRLLFPRNDALEDWGDLTVQAVAFEDYGTIADAADSQTTYGLVADDVDLSAKSQAYVLDPLDMSFAIYTFASSPTSETRFVLENFDILPRPAGVGVKYRFISKRAFGFGDKRKNFTRGNFKGAVEAAAPIYVDYGEVVITAESGLDYGLVSNAATIFADYGALS